MRKKTILLVDNEKSILESFGNYLGNNNFAVKTAPNAETAVAEIRTTYFDLVVTDLVMDGISGMEVLKETKKANPAFVCSSSPGMAIWNLQLKPFVQVLMIISSSHMMQKNWC